MRLEPHSPHRVQSQPKRTSIRGGVPHLRWEPSWSYGLPQPLLHGFGKIPQMSSRRSQGFSDYQVYVEQEVNSRTPSRFVGFAAKRNFRRFREDLIQEVARFLLLNLRCRLTPNILLTAMWLGTKDNTNTIPMWAGIKDNTNLWKLPLRLGRP